MKKFLSLVILLSVFFIQIHGVTHTDSIDHNKSHSCPICEILSHQPNLAPTTLDFNLSSRVVSEKIFLVSEKNFVPKLFISKSIAPRAPPII